jgi:hypothetical protein
MDLPGKRMKWGLDRIFGMSDSLEGCGESHSGARAEPSAAKAVLKNNAVTAAVNRCATQNQQLH